MRNFPNELRHGSGTMMALDSTRLLLSFKEPPSPADLNSLLKRIDLQIENMPQQQKADQSIRRFASVVNHTATKFWVHSVTGKAIDDAWFDKVQETFAKTIEWIGPVYRLKNTQGYDGLICPLPDVLIIQFNKPDDVSTERELERMLAAYGLAKHTEKSKYLNGRKYLTVKNVLQSNAYTVFNALSQKEKGIISKLYFENMPMLTDNAFTPNDTLFASQWGMTQINAPGGWDITTGASTTVVAVIDYAFDLTHPDISYLNTGINLSTLAPGADPSGASDPNHGTACAGIISGGFNNSLGIAGLAGGCRILPIARVSGSDAELAIGINYAADNGASVLSMSFGRYAPGEGFGPTGWDFTIIDPAIEHAVNDRGCVVCAASGNENTSTHNRYPARHPLVMACGASSTDDNRKTTTSPDGEPWGANYGTDVHDGETTGVSVVAPGVLIPTTDRQSTGGYNPAAGTGGDYTLTFNGTSSATPHVAAFAALIRSQYPSLTTNAVRRIIEATAERVGSLAYAETPGKNNGTWNQEMGYGRINVLRGLDFADVLIKDWSGDDGTEPSAPAGGNFWDFSDIVVRVTDDNIFEPSDPSQSKNVERGQQNFIYIQATNHGPRDARNVTVGCRITPFVGTQFQYPSDWTTTDAMHVEPTPVNNTFTSIAAGSSMMAKFAISAAQTDTLYGWENDHPWHPCLLASVNADNDYAFASGTFATDPNSLRKNNLAQRNLSVINVLGDTTLADIAFPFVAGHALNNEQRMQLTFDRKAMPSKAELLVSLDDDGSFFPLVRFDQINKQAEEKHSRENELVYLERTRVETVFGCCRGVLTLEKGSSFKCSPKRKLAPVKIKGGELIIRNGKRYVRIEESIARVQFEKGEGQIYPLSVVIDFGKETHSGKEYTLQVSQQNEQGITVGGAAGVYIFR